MTAGDPFGLSVAVADPYGNVETILQRRGRRLACRATRAAASCTARSWLGTTNGEASFSGLSIFTAASGYTIEATSGSLIAVTTNPIDVTPAAPAKLEVLVQPPANMVAGADFGLGIVVEDAYGNLATQFTGNVSIALSNDPGGAPLSGGPLTVAATAGVANFLANFTDPGRGRIGLHHPGNQQRSDAGDHECHHGCPRGGHATGRGD